MRPTNISSHKIYIILPLKPPVSIPLRFTRFPQPLGDGFIYFLWCVPFTLLHPYHLPSAATLSYPWIESISFIDNDNRLHPFHLPAIRSASPLIAEEKIYGYILNQHSPTHLCNHIISHVTTERRIKMHYKNLGTTINFRCYEGKHNFYNIVATYRPSKKNRDHFIVGIKLSKIVRKNGGEYLFEHPIDTQEITAKSYNVKNHISRIVNHAVTYGKFDSYVNDFKQEIEDAMKSL